MTDNSIGDGVGEDKTRNKKRSRVRSCLARSFRFVFIVTALLIVVASGFMIGGFLKFTDTIASYETPAASQTGDAIVVFTGGVSRISKALELLEAGDGKRLLISGVNPATTVDSILRKNGNQSSQSRCCIDIDKRAQDTIGNAIEVNKWIARHKFKSLLIVTSNYHMPRSIMETSRKLPDTQLIPVAVSAPGFEIDIWYKDRKTLRLLLFEYMKFVVAQMRPILSATAVESVRADIFGN